MKKLELNQMEILNGGSAVGCIAAGLGVISLGIAFTLISGPIGFWAMAELLTAAGATGLGLADCTAEYVL